MKRAILCAALAVGLLWGLAEAQQQDPQQVINFLKGMIADREIRIEILSRQVDALTTENAKLKEKK